MKKRIFLIVSSIVCCLVTLSLVVYTIVKATTTSVSDPAVDDPTIDANKPGYEESTNSVNLVYNMIVGDVLSDEALINNPEVLPTMLTLSEDNTVVAVEAGNGAFAVDYNGVKYNYDITVWVKGSGSSDDPFNIVRTEDLVELVATNNGSNVHYSQRCDLDLAGANWTPIGNNSNPFASNYDGNGFTINNMSIVVTPDNIDSYTCDVNGFNAMYLGFFGMVVSEGDTLELKNIVIQNANIDTTAIDNVDTRGNINLSEMFVGTLAGYVYNANIDGCGNTVTSTIKSSAGDHDGVVDGAVAGFVGCAYNSTIANYTVNTTINASDVAYVDANGVKYGANVAGLVGDAKKTTIHDCNVSADIVIANYSDTKVAGAVINLGNESNIERLTVLDSKIKLNKVVADATQCVRMAGAIDYISSSSTVSMSKVENVQIYGIGCGQISGFVSLNMGSVVDCSASGNLKGAYVAGLADINKGIIQYSDSTVIDAVNVVIDAQMWGAGLVNDNYGTIKGSDLQTVVRAEIYWYPVAEKYFDRANMMFAGIATINSGKISNLYVKVNIYDAVNAGGAIGWADGTGATLENSEVYTTVRTIKQNGNSAIQTYTVGGVISVVGKNSSITINNVIAKMSVNSKAIASYVYTLDVFGAMVGKSSGNVRVGELEIGVSVYANDTLNVDQATGNCATVKRVFGASGSGASVTDIEGKCVVYGNVKINGTLTNISSYPER